MYSKGQVKAYVLKVNKNSNDNTYLRNHHF